jgi:hypothetical protein
VSCMSIKHTLCVSLNTVKLLVSVSNNYLNLPLQFCFISKVVITFCYSKSKIFEFSHPYKFLVVHCTKLCGNQPTASNVETAMSRQTYAHTYYISNFYFILWIKIHSYMTHPTKFLSKYIHDNGINLLET